MTLLGATGAAKMPFEAAELASIYIDSAYRSIDGHEPDEHGGLPGVTREYHQVVGVAEDGTYTYVGAGIEGYGWGALSIHLLIRFILGLREEEAGVLTVAPMLPRRLRQVGASYRVEPIQWGKYALSVECIVRDTEGYSIRLGCCAGEGFAFADEALKNNSLAQWQWKGKWGEERSLELPRLAIFSAVGRAKQKGQGYESTLS
jgi:hypothetical protein